MKSIRWDEQKNEWLRRNRGISFEAVSLLLIQGRAIRVMDHPNQEKYPGQKMAIVEMGGYAWIVPYVEAGGEVFLKTIIPSRKATRDHLEKGHEKPET